jgi:type VI secretion system protein ImpA
MSIVDVDSLLQELTAEAPCGPNLEYDPAFFELEQSVIGKPEVQYGDVITPAVPPEWKQVKKQALELLGRSRDLRAAVPLLRALLALHGMPGFADGARLIERLIAERWDSVHPQLDPDDDLDPTLRINSLATLADAVTVLRELKETAFIQLPGLGPLSLRLVEQANGEVPVPEGQQALSLTSIEAAMRDVAPETLAAATSAAGAAFESIVNVETTLVRQVGSTQALNLDALTRPLRRIRDLLAAHQPAGQEAPAEAVAEGAAGPAAGAAPAAAAPQAISGEITSRADVVRMLDKILTYYQRNEPSSPVPMLLERAKRLAPKNFFEIMEELAPDSMNQLMLIRGPQQDGQ